VIAVTSDATVTTGGLGDIVDAVYQASGSEALTDTWTIPLYHMGNHRAFHGYVYDLLVRVPGITVLHDGNLLPFINAKTLEVTDLAGYVREVSFDAPQGSGHRLAWDILRGDRRAEPETMRLIRRVAEASLGVVVHSEYLRQTVLTAIPSARVRMIPHLDLSEGFVASSEALSAEAEALGLGGDAIILGAFGFAAPSKRLDLILHAMARLVERFPNLQLLCVGRVVDGYDLVSLVRDLGLVDHVRFTDYVPLVRLQTLVALTDIGLSLRQPTWGESSGTLMRLMAASKPVLVSDDGAFANLPDGAVVKVRHGDDELEQVTGALLEMLEDPDQRRRIGRAAGRYVREACAPERVAAEYADFVWQTIRGAPR
jgi:glycosyltransferase involved in cell wall biosynthesis